MTFAVSVVSVDAGHIKGFLPPAGRKNLFNSFDFTASPQNQTKMMVISLLPQAIRACSRGDRVSPVIHTTYAVGVDAGRIRAFPPAAARK
jgi:hypothetical protein